MRLSCARWPMVAYKNLVKIDFGLMHLGCLCPSLRRSIFNFKVAGFISSRSTSYPATIRAFFSLCAVLSAIPYTNQENRRRNSLWVQSSQICIALVLSGMVMSHRQHFCLTKISCTLFTAKLVFVSRGSLVIVCPDKLSIILSIRFEVFQLFVFLPGPT